MSIDSLDYPGNKPSLESNEEILQFQDAPELFEFNKSNEFADLDNYEAAPAPYNWYPEPQKCE